VIREDLLLRKTAKRTMIGLSFLVNAVMRVTVMPPPTAMAAITFGPGAFSWRPGDPPRRCR
jgi:hypothetical protein